MANVPVLSGAGATVYLKAAGAGSDVDPFVPSHNVDTLPADPLGANADAVVAAGAAGSISAKLRRISQGLEDLKTGITLAGGAVTIGAALPAGTNNVGDVDVLSLVGDNADLDSDAGTDNHAVVAIGLPAAGGHVVGGVGANPFRIDTVASTVQPVSIASNYVANVIASVIGNPAVIASIAGNPAVSAFKSTYAALQYTSVPVNVSGSGLVAGNIVASSAKPLILCGYQIVSTGTVVVGIYDGSFNNALTGSFALIPSSGIAQPPNPWAIHGVTASGRALILGLSASCNIAGAVQYYEG